jgi:CHAT domain-containing protein
VFGIEARGMGQGRSPKIDLKKTKLSHDHENLALIYHRIGPLYEQRSRLREAEMILQESLRVYEAMYGKQHTKYAQVLLNLASVHRRQKQFALAEQELGEVRPILGDEQHFHRARAALLADQGQFAEARVEYLETLRLLERSHGERAIHNIYLFQSLVFVEQALKHPDALAHAKRLLDLWQYHVRLLPGFASEKRMLAFLEDDSSIDHLISMALAQPASVPHQEAALTWVLRRKGLILETLCHMREDWLLVDHDPGLSDKAERLRSLREQWANLSVRGPGVGDPADHDRQLKELRREVDRLQAELHRSLAQKRPERFRTANEADVASLRRRLPPGAALVEFVRYTPFNYDYRAAAGQRPWLPARYAAFVVTAHAHQSVRLIDVGAASALEEKVSALRQAIDGFPAARRSGGSEMALEAAYHRHAQALYNQLLAPLRPAIDSASTLFLVPDGCLHAVPFAALVDDRDRYLIESYRLAYLSSGRDLFRPAATAQGRGTVIVADPELKLSVARRLELLPPTLTQQDPATALAVRGPAGRDSRGGYDPLPHARKEREDIETALKSSIWGPTEAFVGEDALEERLKAVRSPRLLHLATHGFFHEKPEPGNPVAAAGASGEARLRAADNPLLRSGLVLAGAGARRDKVPEGVRLEDGWLTAEEVALLDLRGTDLVVLSACESGRGDVRSGEGVYGLRRAFFYAGARTLVATLFKVPDEETRPQMKAFYQKLAAGQGKLEALHQAQLEALRGRRAQNQGVSHPFYWASFLLIGEP